jgi:hypothetical protein
MKARSEYHDLYKVRTHFVVNNGDGVEQDPDLTPVVFSLPEPPKDWTKIKNYGLHPDDQIYRKDEYPKALQAIEDDIIQNAQKRYDKSRNNTIRGYVLLKAYWAKLSDEAERYKKEIKWMRHVIWKRNYGEWVFIGGKLTWLPPRYYMYVNFWNMSVAKGYDTPEFRVRDWKSACVNHYLRHTKETFVNLNKKGFALKDEDGNIPVRDTGSRVFYGPIRPKNRRSGATHEALNEAHETVCTGFGKKANTISKSVDDVIAFFEEMLFPAWRRMPMFLKPTWVGASAEGTSIEYMSQGNMMGVESMESKLYYLKATEEIVLDSKRLDFVLLDEQGKKTGGGRVDVSDRWDITKQTLSTGNGANIHGFAMNPSTAEEMEAGAKQYKMMCDMSNFYQRSITGQTKSGLMLIYFPAQYCLEGFVDCFGEAVVDAPTQRQIDLTAKHYPDRTFVKSGFGARAFLIADREQYLMSSHPDAQRKYRSLQRKHPMKYSESWIGDSGDTGFPIIKIDARLAEADREGGKWMVLGDFARIGGPDGQVVWQPSSDGRFELSYHPKMEFTNRQKRVRVYNAMTQRMEMQKGPVDPLMVTGCDPFGFDNKSVIAQRESKSRKSDGGIATYYPHDDRVDPYDTPLDELQSDRFVLSYRFRPPSLDAYNEDILMACIYLNSWCYPERNATATWEYFIRRGYGGYLKYDRNPVTGKHEDKPGYWVGAGDKSALFTVLHDYLQRNAHRERHASFLRECKEIPGPEELKNYDRLAAHGAALMGARDSDVVVVHQDGENKIQKAYEVFTKVF